MIPSPFLERCFPDGSDHILPSRLGVFISARYGRLAWGFASALLWGNLVETLLRRARPSGRADSNGSPFESSLTRRNDADPDCRTGRLIWLYHSDKTADAFDYVPSLVCKGIGQLRVVQSVADRPLRAFTAARP